MATETDFAQILERLENKIDAQSERLEQKIDAQGENLGQKIDAQGERLEQKIDAQGEHLGQKIDAQGEKLQSIDTRLARVEENTTNLQQENSTLREQITKQDNRVWGLLVSGLIALLGILGKILLLPNK